MIKELIKNRILILDGATGTMLQKYGDTPEMVIRIHREYIEAGADIIKTNTFNSLTYQESFDGAKMAREVADEMGSKLGRKVYVAGSMGPTSKMLSLSPDVERGEFRATSFDQMAQDYASQTEGLIDGGADLLLVETIFDGLNTKAALYAISKVQENKGTDIPVMISATINDRQGRILTGIHVEELYEALSHYPIFSFGLNCSFGAEDMEPVIARLSAILPCAVSIYPNAGLPDTLGGYPETPQMTAGYLKEIALKGYINIAGGCCGTTPDHIRAISDTLKGIAPRPIGQIAPKVGIQEHIFINVGERTNVAGSRKFAKLIAEKKYDEASVIARNQIRDGATIIDINMDDPMLDAPKEMETFVRIISNDPDITKASFMIDSSDWDTILAGLKNTQKKCIVNSISLKEGEEEFIRRAKEIHRLGASVVVMAFDEMGQATDYERKIAICRRSYDILTQKCGYSPEDIIFDNNILTIGTGLPEHNDYAVDFIKAVKWVKENLPGAKTSGGVSNLSFAFRGNNKVREAMHSVFLYHAINQGLDMAIVNPSMLQLYNQIEPTLLRAVEDVVLNTDPEATERLTTIAQQIKGESAQGGSGSNQEQWRGLPWEKRVEYALVTGTGEYLEEDLADAKKELTPLQIIEGPLLHGMEIVGGEFREGKMFLPQVIKSSKIMKRAVDILQGDMEGNTSESKMEKKKMVLATVKGDVHDIGKNILGIVLACNNIEVIDLGVMVENTTIMEAIKEHNADFIGVSGLITPSLNYMEELCRMMESASMEIPIFIGGATTSALHTAVKLAPLYSHAVIYTNSASDCANVLNKIQKEGDIAIADILRSQEELRELYHSKEGARQAAQQAKGERVVYPAESFVQPEGFGEHNMIARSLPIENVVEMIDWNMFLSFWGFKGRYPEIIYSNPEAEKCYESAVAMLDKMIVEQSVELSVCVRFFDAYSEGDEIVLDSEGVQERFEAGRYSDFVPPRETGIKSAVGLFAIKVEDKQKCCDCKSYDHILREALCARIAQAASEWLDGQISEDGRVVKPAFGYPSVPDHSLKKKAFELLGAEEKLGLKLTSSYAMVPTTSVCGMIISHPEAKYL
ncbi:MAG: methionine synthase [Bacteroidales bacterium]|nr:methionine synthase [Bacteroidales bacterium]